MSSRQSHASYFTRFKLVLLILTFCLLVLGGVAIYSSKAPRAKAPKVVNITEGGKVQNPARPQFVRDGGAAARLGNRYLWTFGDTLFHPKSVDGSSGRSNTAAYAELSSPTSVSEPLDTNGAPQQFIPFSASDLAYNSRTKKGDDRYAIWPGLVVPRPETNDALVYFVRLKVNPGGGGLNYDLLNSGLARVAEGSTTAEVLVPELFKKPETLYNGPGFSKDGFIYSYDCPSSSLKACSLARVKIAEAERRDRYQFWDGKHWQADIKKAVRKFPGSSAGTSLGWLAGFNRYVVFYNQPFSKRIMMTTSPSLTEGWEKPYEFYRSQKRNYAITYHPDLTAQNGHVITLTYYQPGDGMQAIKALLK